MDKPVNDSPKVSIGIPVYNGENYLEAALNSLLQQSFQNFEVVISDNASTDRTQEICLAFQSQDQRIRYHRSPKNLGAAANYKQAFRLSKGELFKWMAHDDTCSSNYLARCVEVLDNDSDVVLCYPKVELIDEGGYLLPRADENTFITQKGRKISTNVPRNFMSSDSSERYSEVLFRTHECYEFFGLSRRSIIEQTSQHDSFYGSDKVLLCELSLMGKLQSAPDAIGYFRIHREQSQSLKSSKEKAEWIAPQLKYGALTSRMKCLQGYFRSIFVYPLSPSERLKCLRILLAWTSNDSNWRTLIKEVSRRRTPKVGVSS